MEVALQTIRTPVIRALDRSVYELDIAPNYYRTGKLAGLEARFIQCTDWHTSRIREKSAMVTEALKATYLLTNVGDLPREERHFKWFVAQHVDVEIALSAKSGIVLRREDFPMYRAAKRELDDTRQKAILAKDYYELLKGGCSVTFINATNGPLRLALEGNLEKG